MTNYIWNSFPVKVVIVYCKKNKLCKLCSWANFSKYDPMLLCFSPSLIQKKGIWLSKIWMVHVYNICKYSEVRAIILSKLWFQWSPVCTRLIKRDADSHWICISVHYLFLFLSCDILLISLSEIFHGKSLTISLLQVGRNYLAQAFSETIKYAGDSLKHAKFQWVQKQLILPFL